MIFRVGITGGIGSGKSLVCRIFETLGVSVYYADTEAKRIMLEDKKVKEQLIELLGDDAYKGNNIDRSYIASEIFNNEMLLTRMNQIVHPAVHSDFIKWSGAITDSPYVIKEAAIMFESGSDRLVDATVLVYASETTRIERVRKRDGVEEKIVKERMKNQMDEEEKRQLADHIITNDNEHMVIPQVIALHEEFLIKSN